MDQVKKSTTSSSNRKPEGIPAIIGCPSHEDDHYIFEADGVKRTSIRPSVVTSSTKIAVFGALGKTGRHFIRLALDAGYSVRALIDTAQVPAEFRQATDLRLITGRWQDEAKVARVIRGVSYVVILFTNDAVTHTQNTEYPHHMQRDFIRQLYPLLMQERSIKVLLYQATSLAMDMKGGTPMLSKIVKSVRRTPMMKDQDDVIQFISRKHGIVNSRGKPIIMHSDEKSAASEAADDESSIKENEASPHFSFIVTRPTVLLKDGPPCKKLAASKSQPGPFPVSHIDLAEFTLNALVTNKMYNSCPYVVADSF